MDLVNLEAAWQSCDARLSKTIRLNLHYIQQLQTEKIRSGINPLFWYRIIELFFHVLAIVLLTIFLVHNLDQTKYAFSAIALLAFYIVASIMCLLQLVIIQRIDYSNDIVLIQGSILKLRTHMINSMRLAVLFIPAFVGFPLVVSKTINDLQLYSLHFMDLESQYPGDWWQIQKLCVVVLTPLCILFYLLVNEKNIHRPWVHKTIRNTAGRRLTKALEALRDLDDLKKGVA